MSVGTATGVDDFEAQQRHRLVKSMRLFDLVFFGVATVVSLDTIGYISGFGAQTFTWMLVLVPLFVLPYALLMSEMGGAFVREGGPYHWMRLAWGRGAAALGAVLYWITNPLWLGGSLAFLATEAWSSNLTKIEAGSAWDYAFKLVFIWIGILVAIISLKRGKWIPNIGALMRVVLLGLFTLTTIIYAIKHGAAGFAVKDLKPTGVVFFALVPLLLFNYVGFELQNGAAEEMENPQKDVPLAIVRSGITGVLLYAIPIFAILVVLPAEKVTGIGGFLDAVKETFSVYGGASSFLLGLMTICFVGTLLTSGAVWMIGSDRILAVAAYDGAFPGFFGVFNRKFGTPVRVNTMSGIFATIFMVVAVAAFNGGTNSKFVVVLDIAISTTLISYLWVFPAVIKLRYTHGHVHRPYRIPGDKAGMWVAAGLTTFWTALGSFVAVFPGVLERLFGISYDFHDTWGVSRTTFEVLTLGTLAVVFGIAIVGYWLGRDVRERVAVIPLEAADIPPAPAAIT